MLAFCCDICLRRSNLCAICVAAHYKRGLVFVSLQCYGLIKTSLHQVILMSSNITNIHTVCKWFDMTWFLSWHFSFDTLHSSFVISDLHETPHESPHLVSSKQHKHSRCVTWYLSDMPPYLYKYKHNKHKNTNTNTIGVSHDTCWLLHHAIINTTSLVLTHFSPIRL